MTDDTEPADAGTTEEQREELTVDAVDAAEGEQEQQEDEEIEMAEELAEAQDRLANVDPENVAHCAVVVSTKQPMEGSETEDCEAPDGFSWRVTNPDLEGYEDVNDVMATIASFNDALDDCEIPTERPRGMLGGLLGLE